MFSLTNATQALRYMIQLWIAFFHYQLRHLYAVKKKLNKNKAKKKNKTEFEISSYFFTIPRTLIERIFS